VAKRDYFSNFAIIGGGYCWSNDRTLNSHDIFANAGHYYSPDYAN